MAMLNPLYMVKILFPRQRPLEYDEIIELAKNRGFDAADFCTGPAYPTSCDTSDRGIMGIRATSCEGVRLSRGDESLVVCRKADRRDEYVCRLLRSSGQAEGGQVKLVCQHIDLQEVTNPFSSETLSLVYVETETSRIKEFLASE